MCARIGHYTPIPATWGAFQHEPCLLFPLRPSWLSIEFLDGFRLLSPKDSGPPGRNNAD